MINTRNRQKRLVDSQRRQQRIGHRPDRHAGPVIDTTANQYQFDAVTTAHQGRHWQAVGHHLQPPIDQLPRDLVSRAATVQQDRLAVENLSRRRHSDLSFVNRIVIATRIEYPHFVGRTGPKHAAVRSLGLAQPLQHVDIATHRRLADRQRIGQLSERRESARLHNPPQFATTVFTHEQQANIRA